jgi:hypothetical protein
MMNVDDLLNNLRQQPFYRGQILRVRNYDGHPAQTAPLPILLERVPRLDGGSVASILSVLGLHDVHAELIAALSRSFPTPDREKRDPREDCVLISPFSYVRELLWQLVAILDALDEGRVALIVTPTLAKARAAHQCIEEVLRAADVGYAVDVAGLTAEADFSVFDQRHPRLISCSADMLRNLLCDSRHASVRDDVFSGLGRIILPAVDTWPSAMASHLAHLMRQVHVECAERGVTPALVATAQPEGGADGASAGISLKNYITSLWGRFLEDASFVRADSGEAPPVTLVGYTGGLIRNPENPDEWIREDIGKVASDLLGWLVGEFKGQTELHYVLDISGSMTDSLPAVRTAVVDDLRLKLDAKALREDDRVKLTVFESDATTVYDGKARPACDGELAAAMASVEGGGGTDIPIGLGAALRNALADDAPTIHIVLFSDGGSPVSAVQRQELVRTVRMAQTQGRAIHLLYVVLDMDPPMEVRNLVTAMGGKIFKCSTADLEQLGSLEGDQESLGPVVLLSGEYGIPERAMQAHQAGKRRLLFARHAWDLDRPSLAARVSAVVVSGKFGNRSEILNEVRHLGRESFPVFVLIEPDAWSRVIIEDYPETDTLGRLPPARPSNEHVRKQRLREYIGQGECEDFVFRYLADGPPAYEEMLSGLRVRDAAADVKGQPPEVPPDYELVEHGHRRYLRHASRAAASILAPLDTFGSSRIRLEGGGVRTFCDGELIPLIFHSGALVDGEKNAAEVDRSSALPDVVALKDRSFNRTVPLLDRAAIEPLAPGDWERSAIQVEGLGKLCWGPVRLRVDSVGTRVFDLANLDDRSGDERYRTSKQVSLETCGFCWVPDEADESLTAGLANLIRLALPAVLGHADQTALVIPDGGCVWIFDLAPGGNGVVDRFAADRGLLVGLLRLAGRVALECPCEGGFAGSSDQSKVDVVDTGCPRCTRVVGPVILDGNGDKFRSIAKKPLLEWLLARRHLPASAALHLKEKYEGIIDATRVFGEDVGSRRGCMRTARRLFADRLGIDIDDADIASFAWLTDREPENCLGLYSFGPNTNQLSIRKNLREWLALDVTAHEFFHNLQAKVPDLFNHTKIGSAADPPLPFDGKLFIEGSALWGESHIVDALAIRSALTLANLRHGDEYGDGFRALKYLEEHHGGVNAVLQFLTTGDIALATGGHVRNLSALYSAAGISLER